MLQSLKFVWRDRRSGGRLGLWAGRARGRLPGRAGLVLDLGSIGRDKVGRLARRECQSGASDCTEGGDL